VALGIAWADYLVLREQCQEIFLELHDVIAGLVYREKNFEAEQGRRVFDRTIFYIADELVTYCAKGSSTFPSFTVPSPRETLARTLGRIVRMRYSEWTVWSLPLIAHEFAHVVLSEKEYSEIATIFDTKSLRSRMIELNREMGEALKPDPNERMRRRVSRLVRQRVETKLRYFLADAWSTWVIGPAYACAAIHLRLNPTQVSSLEAVDSFDRERAEVILGVLGKMGQPGIARNDFPREEFAAQVNNLKTIWNDMVHRANPPETADSPLPAAWIQARDQCLKEIVEVICRKFLTIMYFKLLLYTQEGSVTPQGAPGGAATPQKGWAAATGWCRRWMAELEGSMPLPAIDVTGFSTIRDALNAGWQCRMTRKQTRSSSEVKPARSSSEVKRIEDALRRLCGDISEWRLRNPGRGHTRPIL
jgi:hypothetical protein